MNAQRDWFTILGQALQAEPERAVPTIDTDRLARQAIDNGRKTTRRRRWFLSGILLVAGISSTAVAAALWPREKPAQPAQGIACHATLETVGNAYVIPPAADPLTACAELWLNGSLPDQEDGGTPSEAAPPLFACIGPGGGLDVFPNLNDPPLTCSNLGLADADTDLADDPTIALDTRLADEINATCVTADDAAARIQDFLDELGLDDWTVQVREGTTGCVLAGQDPTTKTVFLTTHPVQQPTQ